MMRYAGVPIAPVMVLLPMLLLLLQPINALHQTPRFMPGLAKVHDQRAQLAASATSHRRMSTHDGHHGDQAPFGMRIAPHLQQSSHAAVPGYPDVKVANLTQRVDHFGNSTDVTFEQRYFYSLRHYKPNSGKPTPVYVLESGETDAANRLPYLDTGILDILANATNGIGVIIEHRYYGTSIPDLQALGGDKFWTVDQLRWLTTELALEDNAQFVKRMTFDGVPEAQVATLQAPNTPVISYGGSYPGGKSAFLRLLYPDLFFGSLASSAVVSAVAQFPQYYYPIAAGAQQDCTQAIQASIGYIDSIVAPEPQRGQDQPHRNATQTKQLQRLFGLEGLDNVADFVNVLTIPIGYFQSLVWDPAVSSNVFAQFCTALVDEPSGPVSPAPQGHTSTPTIDGLGEVPAVVQRYAHFIRTQFVEACLKDGKETVESCFGTEDWSSFTNATQLTDRNTISWTFQYCFEWGYLMTAPPYVQSVDSPYDFVPSGPKLISSLLDLPYASAVCRHGFLPGKHFTMPKMPQTDRINRYGNFSLAMERLAFIDGQFDPWRPATVHSEQFAYGGNRISTLDRPFELIENCWHHCDEYGNRTFEPPRVQRIHQREVRFVQHWLTQWNATKA